eukprot:m.1005351 g.1005351  ORF g.1005351 m.1005351 type:complete len:842 (-) comp24050_c0_seq1:503-3028(-)
MKVMNVARKCGCDLAAYVPVCIIVCCGILHLVSAQDLDPTGRVRQTSDGLDALPCSGRCTFDTSAEYCKPTGSATPCTAFQLQSTCPSESCRWITDSAGTTMCAPEEVFPDGYNASDPGNLTYSSFSCADNSYEVMCEGLAHCTWNYAESTCQRRNCADMLTPGTCAAIPGCVYDTELFYCMDSDELIPCPRLWIGTRCEDEAERCVWNATRSQCFEITVPESDLACSEFVSMSKCPLDRCRFDPYASVCTNFDEVPSCSEYRTSAACPSAGTEYESERNGTFLPPASAVCTRISPPCNGSDVYQIAHTATSDRLCAAVSSCNASEYLVSPATTTSDTRCAAVSTTCMPHHVPSAGGGSGGGEIGEAATDDDGDELGPGDIPTGSGMYLYANATATTDIVCRYHQVCPDGVAFESSAPTNTSDRVCAEATECLPPNFYILEEPTTTTDRVCSTVSDCMPWEYQINPATLYSDRQCDDLVTCEAGQYESEAPILVSGTAISNRVCMAISPACSATQYEAAAPTATTDRDCREISTTCPSADERIVCPATPFSDIVCLHEDDLGQDDEESSGDLSGGGPMHHGIVCRTTTATTSTVSTSTTTSTVSSTSTTTSLSSVTSSTATTTTDTAEAQTYVIVFELDFAFLDVENFTAGVRHQLELSGVTHILDIVVSAGSVLVSVTTGSRSSYGALSAAVMAGTMCVPHDGTSVCGSGTTTTTITLTTVTSSVTSSSTTQTETTLLTATSVTSVVSSVTTSTTTSTTTSRCSGWSGSRKIKSQRTTVDFQALQGFHCCLRFRHRPVLDIAEALEVTSVWIGWKPDIGGSFKVSVHVIDRHREGDVSYE